MLDDEDENENEDDDRAEPKGPGGDDPEDDDDGGPEGGPDGGADERGPGRVAKSERILNLIAVLLRSEEPVPVSEILGKVTGYDDKASRESLMRRFERDKKVLRDMGIPVEHAVQGPFGTDGYRIPRSAYFLDEVDLPPASGKLLRALFAWAHAGGGELSADLRSALVKLGYFVDEAEPPVRALDAIEPALPDARRTVDAKLTGGLVVGRNLELLSEAVHRQRRVRFRYYTIGRDEEVVREVDPYGLGFANQAWNRGAWYLVGHCHLRKGLRVFKVQRIRGEVRFARPDAEEPDFRVPAGFRVRDHLGKARWEYHDLASAFRDEAGRVAAEPSEDGVWQTARVHFEAAVSPEVRALVPSARLVETHDGFETLEFQVRRRRPFARFLLRYVPRVRVVSPPELEALLREVAREVLARYEGSPT